MERWILDQILNAAVTQWASDVHISEDSPIILRLSWELTALECSWNPSKDHIKVLLMELLQHDEEKLSEFSKEKDMDFAYLHDDGTSFRINAFYKLWKISVIMRRIESEAKSMSELWLPPGVEKFTKLKQGLVIITWPTGSWKSTSMVSILDEINKTRTEHIITIEDPVEFIFKDKKSIFSQREVWRDTNSFETAI